MASTPTNVFSNATTRAADSAHKAVDAAAGAAAPLIDSLSSRAHSTVDLAADTAGAMADKLTAASESLQTAGNRVFNSSVSYVKENPLTAIGIAVAIGYVLSRLNHR